MPPSSFSLLPTQSSSASSWWWSIDHGSGARTISATEVTTYPANNENPRQNCTERVSAFTKSDYFFSIFFRKKERKYLNDVSDLCLSWLTYQLRLTRMRRRWDIILESFFVFGFLSFCLFHCLFCFFLFVCVFFVFVILSLALSFGWSTYSLRLTKDSFVICLLLCTIQVDAPCSIWANFAKQAPIVFIHIKFGERVFCLVLVGSGTPLVWVGPPCELGWVANSGPN